MLEKLPEAVGHGLRDRRAGMDKTVIQSKLPACATLDVSSAAFANDTPIPVKYTADGEGLSPPLEWKGIPAQAGSVIVLVEDADAPTANPLVHLIVVNLQARNGGLREGEIRHAETPESGAVIGRNSYLRAAWLPPDPPPGHGVHRYLFQLFALTAGATFDGTPGRDAVLAAIKEHGLASGCLIGTYERPDASIKAPADADAAVSASGPSLAT